MDAKNEQRSLNNEPLPDVIILDPLTVVWNLDGQIAALNEQIAKLQEKRTEALNYAIREQIAEDEHYRLDIKYRRIRSLDITKFREIFPEEYKMVCDIERKEKEEALNHIGEKVNLTLVDKLVKKPRLEAAQGVITIKETVTYGVVPKVGV